MGGEEHCWKSTHCPSAQTPSWDSESPGPCNRAWSCNNLSASWGLGSYRKSGCTVEQTVHMDTVFICIVSLRCPHCSPGWPWNPCCFMASPLKCWAWRDRPLYATPNSWSIFWIKVWAKWGNFHGTVKNNNQEGMRKVAWPWNRLTTSTQQKPEGRGGLNYVYSNYFLGSPSFKITMWWASFLLFIFECKNTHT